MWKNVPGMWTEQNCGEDEQKNKGIILKEEQECKWGLTYLEGAVGTRDIQTVAKETITII